MISVPEQLQLVAVDRFLPGALKPALAMANGCVDGIKGRGSEFALPR